LTFPFVFCGEIAAIFILCRNRNSAKGRKRGGGGKNIAVIKIKFGQIVDFFLGWW
jgi:hypothetical protein